MLKQRQFNVDLTSGRCSNVESTLFKRCVSAEAGLNSGEVLFYFRVVLIAKFHYIL